MCQKSEIVPPESKCSPRFSFKHADQDEQIPAELFANEDVMERFLATVALSSRSHATSALTRAVESLSRMVPGSQALSVSVPKFLELARKKAKRDYEVTPASFRMYCSYATFFSKADRASARAMEYQMQAAAIASPPVLVLENLQHAMRSNAMRRFWFLVFVRLDP